MNPVPILPDEFTAGLLALLQAGGPVLLILLGLSVLALAIVLLKLWQFAALRLGARGFAEQALAHWRAGRAGPALAALSASRSPLARVLEVALRGQARPGVTEATVREEVTRVANAVLENLRGQLRGLEVIATVSPLLGLLGTVLGMIEAFQRLEQAGGRVDPAILSGGIWEALLTTAAGLAVAIPTVLALNGLERVVEGFGHRLEDAVTQVFTRELAVDTPPTAWRGDHGL